MSDFDRPRYGIGEDAREVEVEEGNRSVANDRPDGSDSCTHVSRVCTGVSRGVPVPIIESIELEADGRATVWVKTAAVPPAGVRHFEPLDFRMFADDPNYLEPLEATR